MRADHLREAVPFAEANEQLAVLVYLASRCDRRDAAQRPWVLRPLAPERADPPDDPADE